MLFETPRLRVRHFVVEDAAEIYRLSQEEGMRFTSRIRFTPTRTKRGVSSSS